DRPQGLHRRHPRRSGQLSRHRGGCARRGADRGVRFLLAERLQGGDRVHADHSGAALALAARSGAWRGVMPMSVRKLVFAAVAASLLFPLVPGVPAFWITLCNYIGLFSLVAVGLVLLTGVGGMTSFGQAAFVGFGAYTTAVLTLYYGFSPWLTVFASLAVTGLLALLLGLVTVRLSGHYLPLGTLAWGIAIFFLLGNTTYLGRYDGLFGIPPLTIAGVPLTGSR